MDFISILYKHPVYQSIDRVFSEVSKKIKGEYKQVAIPENWKWALDLGNTQFIYHFPVELKRGDIPITHSFLISYQSLAYSFANKPLFIVEEYWGKNKLVNKIYSPLSKSLVNASFISQTKRTENFLKTQKIKSFFIPPAEKADFSMGGGEYILFVGRMVESKNPRFFVKLAQQLNDEKFLMIGDGPLFDEMKKFEGKLPNFKVLKRVERSRLLSYYYKHSKLLVVPSKKDPINFAVVEALSRSTPVIVSIGVGAADFVPARWRMDNFDADTWKYRIAEILCKEKASRNMAKRYFIKNNLDIDSDYFVKMSNKICKHILKREQ